MVLDTFETAVAFSVFKRIHIFYFNLVFGTIIELKSFIRIIASSAEVAFPPRHWHFDTAPAAKTTALEVFRMVGVSIEALHKLLDFDLFLLVVLLEHSKGTHPSFFDELIIAGKLPGDIFRVITRSEVIVHIHGTIANVRFLHHVFGVELDREKGRI